MNVIGFNHLTLRVSDLERSLAFYTRVLGMTLRHRGRLDAYLEWGSAWLCLLHRPAGPADTGASGVDHVAFSIAEEDFDAAVAELRAGGATIAREPTARGVGRSVNFLDPDGIELELHTGELASRLAVWR